MWRTGIALAVLGFVLLSAIGCNGFVVSHEQQAAKQKALEKTIDPAVDGPHPKRPG